MLCSGSPDLRRPRTCYVLGRPTCGDPEHGMFWVARPVPTQNMLCSGSPMRCGKSSQMASQSSKMTAVKDMLRLVRPCVSCLSSPDQGISKYIRHRHPPRLCICSQSFVLAFRFAVVLFGFRKHCSLGVGGLPGYSPRDMSLQPAQSCMGARTARARPEPQSAALEMAARARSGRSGA